MKNIMHNYQILDDGSDEPIVTTEEEPRFVPSVYEKK